MQEQIQIYIDDLQSKAYPKMHIKRRFQTYQRFANTYDELTVENLIDFYESNDFLIPYHHCLIQADLLAWLAFLAENNFIDVSFYQGFDKMVH